MAERPCDAYNLMTGRVALFCDVLVSSRRFQCGGPLWGYIL